MGFHDALYMLNTPYASQEAVDFADTSMEMVSYYAIKASSDLAKERGKYQSYEGSLWSQGILPLDSIKLLKESRGDDYLDIDEVVEFLLTKKPPMTHVVLTGRNAKEELIAAADLVTEMTLVKHPFRDGIKAQKGVEF